MTNLSSVAVLRCTPLITLASLIALALPDTAHAGSDADLSAKDVQDAAVNGPGTVYDAAYFAQFAPINALDIVRRVPGFQLEETVGEVRGFSGAAGNVVLNGARPATKSERLSAMLARIPAGRVLRIEVTSGSAFGSDYAGKSQVLNVVTTPAGGIDGNVQATATRSFTGKIWGNLEASALVTSGSSTFNISAGTGRRSQVEEGFDVLRRAGDDAELELREKVNTFTFRDPFLSLSWAYDGGENKTANLNLRYSPGRFDLNQTNHVTPIAGPVRDDFLVQDNSNTSYEMGGDITRPLGGGAIKLVGLVNRRDRDNFDGSYKRVGDATIGGFEQYQLARYDEALGRLNWSHPSLAGFTAEFGSDISYNRLENATELSLIDEDGKRTPIDLPIDEATVDELRTESYAKFGRLLTDQLRFDATFAFERSHLKVSGDTTAERNLSFFKPGFTLDWKGKSNWRVQASLRRRLAQLDFYDFISSAELGSDRVNGGNADLMPQRTWEARMTLERPLLGRGQMKLELGHDWASMLQDRILTPEGYDAPGNIGSGSRNFVSLTLDAPLDKLGIESTRLKLGGTLQDTSVKDPLSGKNRAWSGFYTPWEWNLELRRDLSRWSYGVTLVDRADFSFFRTGEIERLRIERIFGQAFAEFRPNKRTTLRFNLENLLDTAGQRYREFFLPDRSAPEPSMTEFRHRNFHVQASLSVNRTFGGSK